MLLTKYQIDSYSYRVSRLIHAILDTAITIYHTYEECWTFTYKDKSPQVYRWIITDASFEEVNKLVKAADSHSRVWVYETEVNLPVAPINKDLNYYKQIFSGLWESEIKPDDDEQTYSHLSDEEYLALLDPDTVEQIPDIIRETLDSDRKVSDWLKRLEAARRR